MQILSNLPFVVKVEALLASMHMYFVHSLKRHLEHNKLMEIIETKGLEVPRNVKIQWTSMFTFAKQVLFKYKSLVMKMVKDILGNALTANTNYEMFF